MAKRIARRRSAKCYKDMGYGNRTQDSRTGHFKTINPDTFKLIVNGREGLAAEEIIRMGSYNALLKNSLPKEFQYYNVDDETLESSHDAFRFALPRGLAWEVLSVYSALSKNHLNLITYAVK
ncbi:hypothetical protein NC653_004026 [Populus alba x Populus x berolinensis]|uniref:Uncharacterized protein n=1 Tax=Populus alba x Populus x berolinensis TaxID=444605 RepID=A0AAD6WLZ6_9ROSI|nr:hypothetical protein NC653_004026 [Populus alba x Populus x berolinensis]